MIRISFLIVFGLVTLAALPERAAAEVTFAGTVFPGTPAEVGPSTEVIVGPANNDLPPNTDPRGSIAVDGSSAFLARRILIGNSDIALARMTVSGPQARVALDEGGGESNPELSVGSRGSGYLRIEDGAWVDLGRFGQSGFMTIGPIESQPSLGIATVEVVGPSTLLTAQRQVSIAGGPTSRLSITEGAVVRTFQSGNDRTGINGIVEVIGRGSELQTNLLYLGDARRFRGGSPLTDGELIIRDGAIVRPYKESFTQASVGLRSRIVLDGGTFALPIDELYGTLEGSGIVTRDVNVEFGGEVSVGNADELEIRGGLTSTGAVRVASGGLSVFGTFQNQNFGEVAGDAQFLDATINLYGGLQNDGTLRLVDSQLAVSRGQGQQSAQSGLFIAERSRVELETPLSNTGRFELIDSTLYLGPQSGVSINDERFGPARLVLDGSVVESTACCGGSIRNGGEIEVRSTGNEIRVAVRDEGRGSLMILQGASVEIASADFYGGIKVEAGGTARFLGEVRLDEQLAVTLTDSSRDAASLVARSNFSAFNEAEFVVGGRLVVEAEGLTSLESDDVFFLINADRLEGDFNQYELPDLLGTLEFLPQLTETTLSVLVIDTTETLPGDFNGDGTVNAADYTVWRDGDLPGGARSLELALWRNNFGRTLSLPAANAAPEPLSAFVALLGVSAGLGFRRTA